MTRIGDPDEIIENQTTTIAIPNTSPDLFQEYILQF